MRVDDQFWFRITVLHHFALRDMIDEPSPRPPLSPSHRELLPNYILVRKLTLPRRATITEPLAVQCLDTLTGD